eukprot:scaffold21437_cov36-Tisochrysis_lutea.AAC.1
MRIKTSASFSTSVWKRFSGQLMSRAKNFDLLNGLLPVSGEVTSGTRPSSGYGTSGRSGPGGPWAVVGTRILSG